MAPREDPRSSYQRGYTKRWARTSKAFLARYPCCGMRPECAPPVMSQCYDEDRLTPATLTDHVRPHHGDPLLFWDAGNYQAMCSTCHQRKTRAGL